MSSPLLDLLRYKRIIIWASLIQISLLGLCLLASYLREAAPFTSFFAGALLGAALASLNVLSLGYAAYAFLLKKSSQLSLLWPCGSFFLLSLSALIITFLYKSSIVGFACGLIAPVPLGMAVAFLERNPLDRTSL